MTRLPLQLPRQWSLASFLRGERAVRRWRWAALVGFLLVGLESLVLAAAFQGPWLILLAPAGVCAVKAMRIRESLRAAQHDTFAGQ